MKNISVLGSTGSVGTQTLEVIRSNKEAFRLTAVTAHSNIDLLEQQVREFKPELAVVYDETLYNELAGRVRGLTRVSAGLEGMIEAAVLDNTDTVVTAIVGIAGLLPTYNAIRNGKNIALANKETLVTAGRIIMKAAYENNISILPVDSEHSAIFQSIGYNPRKALSKIILTASGGPFRTKSAEELEKVTVADALKHPNWKMGKKITIDSATLMNKGLEVIEAKWLFGVEPENIEVCVHPQSIIHSMVEFVDGAVLAQLGLPDMKLPIQYALTYPDRKPMGGEHLDMSKIGRLDFYKPDMEKFPCLRFAFDALKAGDSACVVLNGANEIAVRYFLDGKIGFKDIERLIEATVKEHKPQDCSSIDEVISYDLWAREKSKELFEKGCFR